MELDLSQEEKFWDKYSITIFTILFLAFIFYLVKIYDLTQDVYVRNINDIQAEVSDRIRPVGQVYRLEQEKEILVIVEKELPIQEAIVSAMSGMQVYNTACAACHSMGIGGAPIMGDIEAWSDRITRGIAMLKQNAVKGYIGSVGYMPPKGGRTDLSDAEVEAAVDYMVSQSE